MPPSPDDTTIHPAQIGGAPTALKVAVREAGGDVDAYDLPVGVLLSLGRARDVPAALEGDLDPATPPGPLASRWPHLIGLPRRQVDRVTLGLGPRDGQDMAVSDHAAVVFFDPAAGWTVVNTSGSGRTWAVQRWASLPESLRAQRHTTVDDRLALWVSSDNVRPHCVVMSTDDRTRTEQLRRVAAVSAPRGTLDGAPRLRLTAEQRWVFVRVYEQFLRWDPPYPAPRVTPSRDREYLEHLPEASGDFGKFRTLLVKAIRNADFPANGAGSSASDNLHFIRRVLGDEELLRLQLNAPTRPVRDDQERKRIAAVRPDRLVGDHVRKSEEELALDRDEADGTLSFHTVQRMLQRLEETAGDALESYRGPKPGKPRTARTAEAPDAVAGSAASPSSPP